MVLGVKTTVNIKKYIKNYAALTIYSGKGKSQNSKSKNLIPISTLKNRSQRHAACMDYGVGARLAAFIF